MLIAATSPGTGWPGPNSESGTDTPACPCPAGSSHAHAAAAAPAAGYGGAWYPAGGRTADYGIWSKRPLPRLKCPLPVNGTRAGGTGSGGGGDGGGSVSVYAGGREQVYWPGLSDG